MKKREENIIPDILPVARSKEEARQSYDRISRYYDLFAGVFERKYVKLALTCLPTGEGDVVLEIGFGTGYCLKRISELVGQTGKVYGIDISSGMLEITRRRLKKTGLADRVELQCGDATILPFNDNTFNAVFMSFTLELFETPEIPKVLQEIKRVLKPAGRFVVISMSKENGESIFLELYEWLHKKLPKYIDCRPIYVEQYVRQVGFTVISKEKVKLFWLPGEIVVAEKERLR